MTNAPTRRSRRRKLVFAALLVAVTLAAIESASWVAYWVVTGRPLSIARLRAEQLDATGEAGSSSPGTDASRAMGELVKYHRPHPYLGFVIDPDQNQPSATARDGFPVSRFGMQDDKEPVQKRGPDRFVVGVFGGSVASMWSRYGTERFEATLRRHPALANKRIVIVRAAIGGFKQPQSLLGLQYLLALGAEFDAVVCCDGFNEIALGDSAGSEGLEFPFVWDAMIADVANAEVASARARVMMFQGLRRRVAGAASARPWCWSPTVALAWNLFDSALEGSLAQSRSTAPAKTDRMPVEELVSARVALWSRCARAMDAACRAVGTQYLHVLQPNQYVDGSKQLSENELAEAFDPRSPYRRPVELGYPLLRAAGEELSRSGVAFRDTTMLFVERTDSLWVDRCCHLGQVGNDLLAEDIAKALLDGLDLPADSAIGAGVVLEVDQKDVVLDQLLERVQLRVFATDAAGGRRDVSYCGLQWTSSAPEVVAVDRWGEVVARIPGRSRVSARIGDREVTFDVAVDPPPVSTLSGGHAALGGTPAHLSVVVEAAALRFEIAARRPGTTVFLAMAFEPHVQPLCGGIAYVRLDAPMTVTTILGADGASVSVPLPPGMRENLVIAQALLQEPSTLCGWSTTDALAIRLDVAR